MRSPGTAIDDYTSLTPMEKYHMFCMLMVYHTASALPVVPNCGQGAEAPHTRHGIALFCQAGHNFKGSTQAHE